MIPRLTQAQGLNPQAFDYLQALKKTAFQGAIRGDFASRLVCSTDNSIYQILPQAVIYPRSGADIVEAFRLVQTFPGITFAARGGGTGTNGQSLSPGMTLDCSKYMRQILEINPTEAWVRVQPGVVLDQLNAALKPHGLFFAPTLAPSNRATLGGMINTDACGQGSRLYGRTSDHILALSWVLADGTVGQSEPVTQSQLVELKRQPGAIGAIYRQVDEIVTTRNALIHQTFPKMPRFMTGYNLGKVCDPVNQTFDLNRILAGSEGTLAVITEAKLRLLPIPRCQKLVVVHYRCFDDALLGAEAILPLEPAAIETLDEQILELARQNVIYPAVQDFVAGAQCLNLVEFRAETEAQVQDKLEQLCQTLETHPLTTGYAIAHTSLDMQNLWALRKRGVGLLGNYPGNRKPIAFMEDTAVPPSVLYEYIQELKALLNEAGLDYAMFGHVDVGCIHVRPRLDTKLPSDAALIKTLSDQVVNLVDRYGGVMWGEHGKGFRSAYTPRFFGEVLYQDLRRIKGSFDPENRLNPGKIVTPYGSDAPVVSVESPMRGVFDRQVPESLRSQFDKAFSCNGNGACFNVMPSDVMCPSYKGMDVNAGGGDRIHSPKGRAMLLREWLRQIATTEFQASFFSNRVWHTLQKWWGGEDYSHEVYAGLHGCLSCKACATQCPIHVDIPSLKSQFLAQYHRRYLRPPRDYLIANLETIAALQSRVPGLSNGLMQNPLARWGAKHFLGLVDYPRLSEATLFQGLKERQAIILDGDTQPSHVDRENSVILLLDAFTSFYEAQLVLDVYDVLRMLGYQVYVPLFFSNGKLYHLKGFLEKFEAIAQRNQDTLHQLGELGLPIVGIEPSIVLTYRDEYRQFGNGDTVQVQLLQEFLAQQVDRIAQRIRPEKTQTYQLWGHCTEKTAVWNSAQLWQRVFSAIGIELSLPQMGCCGMAGVYGHEVEHYPLSHGIFEAGWRSQLPTNPILRSQILVTGFSCRSQIQRFNGWRPLHPIQALLKVRRGNEIDS